MSSFFEESRKIGDKSSIGLILEQIGESTFEFGSTILLYSLQNYDCSIQKVLDHIFKHAIFSDDDLIVLFGEIKGDGMMIHGSKVIDEEMIDDMIDQDSEDVQNTIIVKTLRCQVSDVLGSQNCIDLLESIENTDSEVYDTLLMKIIDFHW